MKSSEEIKNKERQLIFSLFLNNAKLKFSDIEKKTKIRSNLVSYHLQKMQKQYILEKKNEHYLLTKEAEKYIPIFSIKSGEINALPVILIALKNKNKILLIKRGKRPYKDYWSLIGGKILLEEDFKKSCLRQIKEKSGINCEFKKINSILQERVVGENIIKHNFILFFVTAQTKEIEFTESHHGKLKWFNLEKITKKDKIIPSDFWLIKNKLKQKQDITEAIINEKEGKIKKFKII